MSDPDRSSYALLRSLLFSLDPERAHALTLRALAIAARLPAPRAPRGTPVRLMGLEFPNRVGLAAGFDKNAVAVDGLARLGFGSIEVGTVTPRPQEGNPRPRVFRFPQAQALVNRAGFPNDGAEACARRLAGAGRGGVIIGVNIGKNAATPLDEAAADYLACLRIVHGVADYVAVNISSPNTAQLRELHSPARLEPLLRALLDERERLRAGTGRPLPLLLKLSPDLDEAGLDGIAATLAAAPIDGLIVANTTVSRADLPEAADVQGGLSGVPLRRRSLTLVRALRERVGAGPTLVGCGGVDSAEVAAAMRAAGADLVQLYTGLVYRGPELVRACGRATG